MLKIRLKRVGRKNRPFYKIVLMENLSKRDGKTFADLGYYNPLSKEVHVERELLHKYLNNGAQPTDSIRHLLYKEFNLANIAIS
jgi:small subunit ribosomal protein S16